MGEQRSFMVACKDYFGFLPDENLKGFSDEMRAVDAKFREEIYAYFKRVGVDCAPPSTLKVGT